MKNLYKKLFDIQHSSLSFKKTAENPFFKSKYLPLEELVETLTPELKKEKLLVVHFTNEKGVNTQVIDTESEESITSTFPLNPNLDPQKIGSAISYAKRYNLGQIFNIITDEDDDGNATTKPRTETAPAKAKKTDFDLAMEKVENTKWTEKSKKEAITKIEESGLYDDDEKFELVDAIKSK